MALGNYTAAGNTKTVYCRFCAATAENARKFRIILGFVFIFIATPFSYLMTGITPIFLGLIPAPVLTMLLVLFM